MMSRASRVLKWVGAGTVLLAAAPIAYAESSAPNPDPNPPRHSSHSCGDEHPDLGVRSPLGSLPAEGGVITLNTGGLPYLAQPGRSACAEDPQTGTATEPSTGTGTGTPDAPDTATPQPR
jgi:hypothetical protein